MQLYNNNILKWFFIIGGPALSLITFLITYFLDPLNFGDQKTLAALPAFLLSIIILIINQNISTSYEIQKASIYSNRIYEAIKDYLHVTTLGSPENATDYIASRLPALREVKNTSFNLEDEIERADEKLFETDSYSLVAKLIVTYTAKNLIWKDIGDHLALDRFRSVYKASNFENKHNYKYKLINHNEPQINFIILEYSDNSREVLFNWDFRSHGQDPTVLISRDQHIIEMFSIQFSHLWRCASNDHDNVAVKSTSKK